MEELEQVVDATAALIDRHVTETLLTKYSLVAHCAAIKRYLLLGQVRNPVAPPTWQPPGHSPGCCELRCLPCTV